MGINSRIETLDREIERYKELIRETNEALDEAEEELGYWSWEDPEEYPGEHKIIDLAGRRKAK